jgi:type IV pilus assembly protein PilQ
MQISALEQDGKGRILSNPKVITSNNKKAVIQQGKSIPYQTVSTSGTQTQFAEAVLGLEVTPSVTNDGYIKLEILAKKDQADFINQSQGVPTIDKKQATTLMYVRDGETAVIGGIYERQENDSENGLPGLRNIPLLGWLFKKNATSDSKTELLIFITPRIIKDLYKNEG